MRAVLMALTAVLLAVPGAGSAQTPDPGLLIDFIKLQDAAYIAQQSARCSEKPDEAKAAFHKRFDARLLAVIQALQKRFSDQDLKAAEAEVHGGSVKRVPPSCPIQPEAIEALIADYDKGLTELETRIGPAVEDK